MNDLREEIQKAENFVTGYDIQKLEEYIDYRERIGNKINLDMGMDYMSGEKKYSPYAFANVEKILFLKEKGFPFITENHEIPVFHNNILENVKCFIKEFNFDINTVDYKGENMAFKCNRFDTMLYLLSNNINLNQVNNRGFSLAEKLSDDMFKVVFEFKPEFILAKDPVDYFKRLSSSKKLTILSKLKDEKLFDYNAVDSNGQNILFYCIEDKRLLKEALKIPDLNLEIVNNDNLDVLALCKSADCAKMLIERGKEFNAEFLTQKHQQINRTRDFTKKYYTYAFLHKTPETIIKDFEGLRNIYKENEQKSTLSNKRSYF